MEQLLQKQRRGQKKLKELSDMRAMELQMERPHTMDNKDLFEDTVPHSRGGGMAGLQRVIGRGRGRPKKMKEMDMEGGDMEGGDMEGGDMEGGDMEGGDMEGGDMMGSGMTNGVMKGGAMKMGKELAEQMKRLHGNKFLEDFHQGVMAVDTKMMGKGSAISARPSGNMVSFTPMSKYKGLPGGGYGGEDVPSGGLVPMAYGNVPQAPASFQRNTVGSGRKSMLGSGSCPTGASVCPTCKGRGRVGGCPCCGMVMMKGSAKCGMGVSSSGAGKCGMGYHGMGAGKCGMGVSRSGAGLLGELGKGVQPFKPRLEGGRRAQRGLLVSHLMKGQGMTLGEASRHIKEHPELMEDF